jgi:hypothetical protein
LVEVLVPYIDRLGLRDDHTRVCVGRSGIGSTLNSKAGYGEQNPSNVDMGIVDQVIPQLPVRTSANRDNEFLQSVAQCLLNILWGGPFGEQEPEISITFG